MRTELGQSLPTITKLQYLSKRLEVPIDTFLENKELALPEEEKQVYTFNDLLLIDYFAMQCQDLIYRREH